MKEVSPPLQLSATVLIAFSTADVACLLHFQLKANL